MKLIKGRRIRKEADSKMQKDNLAAFKNQSSQGFGYISGNHFCEFKDVNEREPAAAESGGSSGTGTKLKVCKKCGTEQLHNKRAWYCVDCNAAKTQKPKSTVGKEKEKKRKAASESDKSESDFDEDDEEEEEVYVVEEEEDTDVRLARMVPMTLIEIAFPTEWGLHWASGMVLAVNPDKSVSFRDEEDGEEMADVDLHDYTWKFL